MSDFRADDASPNTGNASVGDVPKSDSNRFMGVSLKGWAISAISLVSVMTAVCVGFFTVYAKYQSLQSVVATQTKENDILASANISLTSQLTPVAAGTKEKLTEADRHRQNKDRFETFPIDRDPEIVTAEYYPSDGCIHISRKNPNFKGGTTKKKGQVLYGQNEQDFWIPDPDRRQTSNVLPVSTNLQGSSVTLQKVDSEFNPEKKQKGGDSDRTLKFLKADFPTLKPVKMFQGSCMNPHPGNFQASNQQVNACEVQVWRRFADGCTHYQMYNACTGQWAPGVVWTFCNLQHSW